MKPTIQWQDGCIRVRGVCFDPHLTLIDSAQVFHWREEGGQYKACVSGRSLCLAPEKDGFDLPGLGEKDIPFCAHYFDLARDYGMLPSLCAGCDVARRAVEALPGLRVLNQPPWETLLSFITSANNNVPRIRGLVQKLLILGGGDFPTPEALAGTEEARLRALGFGYRAPYLIGAARRVEEGFCLECLRDMPYGEAKKRLCTLPGVGPKVADCVLLFSLGHSCAFPVDVWVARLMERWFGVDPGDRRAAHEVASARFGDWAGIVQQYLFHCARLGLLDL